MKKSFFLIAVGTQVLGLTHGYSQTPASFSNEGVVYVSPNEVVSVVGEFVNKENGNFKTDGTIYYQSDFTNENLYYSSDGVDSGRTVFGSNEGKPAVQTIAGSKVTELHHVVFNNSTANEAFNVLGDLSISGEADFQKGIVKVDSLKGGAVTFLEKSSWKNASDQSHITGKVEKEGRETFAFPIGNKGKFRYAKISAPQNKKDVANGEYTLKDKAFFAIRENKEEIIELINTNEYWLVDLNSNAKSTIMVTLSWADDTTLKEIINSPDESLHVIRWDKKKQMWVDEGGAVDLDAQEVTTIADVKGYGFFTLARVKNTDIGDGDIKIYNFVNANGGDYNDYFRIENINKYPDNTVEIYNRWGSLVYQTKNYNSKNNVFKGYSEGKGTVNKSEKLPSGTYYYLLKYKVSDKKGNNIVKRSGYLHLESN
ncbi:gliding motility-associated C-terminal domain-containing protein [Myroides pelagicus]|uniref:T9SS type B sorting domain-containing protein n=1 Tax=Myroides pelagicus TaxID=270914 RepID=A0A7K1GLR2_9FLAO|nr:gliding motility-associated C-terminal domain-containing protein [Myroides pelagicus]MEC4113126.1 gliding motility-associated C-terminal domain-containing protein [Myroides pelagicus]MTH29825.1 T9SS type B sorting domain-containing protein [Myroides pelagicus]